MYGAATTLLNETKVGIKARRATDPTVLALLVFFLILFPPEETSLYLAGLRLPLSRIILLIFVPIGAARLSARVFRGQYRFVWSDLFAVTAAIWMILSVWNTEGQDSAIIKGSVSAVEFSGAYIIARAYLTKHGQAVALASLIARLIAIVALIGTMDTLLGFYVTHEMSAALAGLRPPDMQEPRFGWIRASGPLEHPILFGAMCAFGILLGTTMRGWKRWFVLIAATIGLISSISSGPMGAALLGLSCLAYRKFTPSFEGRWMLLKIGAASILIPFFILHPTPFGWLLSHFSFDRESAFYRLIIWDVASKLVWNSPVYGIGPTDFPRPDWMPRTVDSVWLVSAMSFGIPGALMIIATLAGSCSRPTDTSRAKLTREESALALTLSIILFIYVYIGFTVHFWGITWTLMGLFAGMRAHLGVLGAATRQKAPAPAVKPRVLALATSS